MARTTRKKTVKKLALRSRRAQLDISRGLAISIAAYELLAADHGGCFRYDAERMRALLDRTAPEGYAVETALYHARSLLTFLPRT